MGSTRRVWLGLVGFLLLSGCSEDDEPRTREEFCQEWARAACSEEVISACQAASAEQCHEAQERFCRELVPQTFSDENGDACIGAVAAAYADADLRGDELAAVLALGGSCEAVIVGPKDEGEACTAPADCNLSLGFDCVMKADSAQGRCEIPEPVGAGRDCSAAHKTCPADFYCDGENCVEGNDEGDPCTIHDECGEAGFCNIDGECEARRSVDMACSDDIECRTGICYEFEGQEICTDRIILARSEPLCDELR